MNFGLVWLTGAAFVFLIAIAGNSLVGKQEDRARMALVALVAALWPLFGFGLLWQELAEPAIAWVRWYVVSARRRWPREEHAVTVALVILCLLTPLPYLLSGKRSASLWPVAGFAVGYLMRRCR